MRYTAELAVNLIHTIGTKHKSLSSQSRNKLPYLARYIVVV
jgi:hypothetical protein